MITESDVNNYYCNYLTKLKNEKKIEVQNEIQSQIRKIESFSEITSPDLGLQYIELCFDFLAKDVKQLDKDFQLYIKETKYFLARKSLSVAKLYNIDTPQVKSIEKYIATNKFSDIVKKTQSELLKNNPGISKNNFYSLFPFNQNESSSSYIKTIGSLSVLALCMIGGYYIYKKHKK